MQLPLRPLPSQGHVPSTAVLYAPPSPSVLSRNGRAKGREESCVNPNSLKQALKKTTSVLNKYGLYEKEKYPNQIECEKTSVQVLRKLLLTGKTPFTKHIC